jgi:hypothetical protein
MFSNKTYTSVCRVTRLDSNPRIHLSTLIVISPESYDGMIEEIGTTEEIGRTQIIIDENHDCHTVVQAIECLFRVISPGRQSIE